MTIVCVDDHPILREGLVQDVKKLLPQADVSAFGDANGALSFVKENGCDILISEIELSGLDGLTLAKHVKKLHPEVNIIFFTVCDEKEHAREVLKIKPSGYLVKPASTEQLAAELRNLRYSMPET